MPPFPATTETSGFHLVGRLQPVLALLQEINVTFAPPFLEAICNTVRSLIDRLPQDIKKNKDECLHLMSHVHEVLYGIAALHMQSETPGTLSPQILEHVGNFMRTMHKIHTFIEAQQQGTFFKQLRRQGRLNNLLKDCQTELNQALDIFKIQTLPPGITNLNAKVEQMHTQLMEIIAGFSEQNTAEALSMVYPSSIGSQSSSTSFSLLPAKPKIFKGRQEELAKIIQMCFEECAPRIALLGAGGIGKTSLARAVSHHEGIPTKYPLRLFIGCESATTGTEIAALIASHLCLKPSPSVTSTVIKNLTRKSDILLVLDNLETAWEPLKFRSGVEDFLALLANVDNVSLIITLRGTERPSSVGWTRPFLPPLGPLSDEAAKEIFAELTDDIHDTQEVSQLLNLTDNLPLAIDLIAHLVDDDSCSSVLSRWETEKTAALSKGYDKKSNLDASIGISLNSPRMASNPGAKDLLRLLSVLPDGLQTLNFCK
ncbi:P-loop containing nucleoside triphosphate hydrolase protein [Roridomyces roridus]|uniref:P-loop containing nucleoside triphosphate hydrolase protein n=1 Tax=Roridomyces roridus TaxID=1738132 RepID=A0AAD7BDS3_9AGAR|nr:P-loop containing nucleoside triphosphate hydrolase protein [Roridomyces roridus]